MSRAECVCVYHKWTVLVARQPYMPLDSQAPSLEVLLFISVAVY